MKRIHTKRITMELSHDKWVALLAAASYGADFLEDQENLPGVSEAACRLVEQLQTKLGVADLLAAAEELEELDENIAEPVGWSAPCLTLSA